MKPIRKRGRPRKSSLSVNKAPFKTALKELINKPIFPSNIGEYPDGIQSRSSNKCLPLLQENWDEDNEKIKQFVSQLNKIESKPKTENDKNIDDFTIIEDFDSNDDAFNALLGINFERLDILCDDENESTQEEIKKITRKSPIDHFCEEGLAELSDETKKMLERHDHLIFQDNLSYSEQIELTINLLNPNEERNYSYSVIGKLFNVKKGTIFNLHKRNNSPKKSNGRPKIVTNEQLELIIQEIGNLYELKKYPDIDDLIDLIYEKFGISILYDTLYRNLRSLKSVKILEIPIMDSTRAEIPLRIIQKHYADLNSIFETYNIPPEFCFNVDESGFIDFVDIKTKTVVIPVEAPDDLVIGTDRNAKRITLIGTISLDGTKLKPMIIVPNKRIEKQLLINGYGQRNLLICSQENGFINSTIFQYWADEIFIPEILKRREETGYTGEAILLMDGCSSHFSDYILDEFTYNGIIPFQEPPGSSDQVQALDLGIFGVQKHIKPKIKTNNAFNDISKNIQQIYNSWIRATYPDLIVSAFNQAGIFTIEIDGSDVVRADVRKARAVRGIEHIPCQNEYSGNKTVKVERF